jgi:hypothetical protein
MIPHSTKIYSLFVLQLHMIGEGQRGATLESLLTKVRMVTRMYPIIICPIDFSVCLSSTTTNYWHVCNTKREYILVECGIMNTSYSTFRKGPTSWNRMICDFTSSTTTMPNSAIRLFSIKLLINEFAFSIVHT